MIAGMREKGIVLKTNTVIIDQLKIWDDYIFVFMKASIQPPVLGVEVDFPDRWSSVSAKIMEFTKKGNYRCVRYVSDLHGVSGWDVLIVLSVLDEKEWVKYLDDLSKQGWFVRGESFSPNRTSGEWIFDPVAVPSVEEFDHFIESLKEYKGK